jgi:mannosyltransferase OCH1-like enzyme
MRAPAIVHQIWFQGWDKRPAKYEQYVQDFRRMNPDFEFKTWDETSLREECAKLGPVYVQCFDELELMITKIDFGRYVVLYNYGGISIDMDMKPLRPLRDTPNLEHDFIISYLAFPYNIANAVNNAVIICTPNHFVMKGIIDEITYAEKPTLSASVCKELYVQRTTGPAVIKNILKRYQNAIFYLDNKYFEPCLSYNPYCKPTPDSIADHKHELSWVTSYLVDILKLFFVIYHYFFVVLAVLTVIVLAAVFSPKWFRRFWPKNFMHK